MLTAGDAAAGDSVDSAAGDTVSDAVGYSAGWAAADCAAADDPAGDTDCAAVSLGTVVIC